MNFYCTFKGDTWWVGTANDEGMAHALINAHQKEYGHKCEIMAVMPETEIEEALKAFHSGYPEIYSCASIESYLEWYRSNMVIG